jgi:hypothetical protein
MIGLLIGYRQGILFHKPPPKPWQDNTDGDRRATQWSGGMGSLNLTYTPSRDGPGPADGDMTQCNNFIPLINSNFSQLSVPYPASRLSVATFKFPFSNTTSPLAKDFFIISRGIASPGTVEFVGSDAPSDMVEGGEDGALRVDVVVRYTGSQELQEIMQVCQMSRADGSLGVGIYVRQLPYRP